MRISPLNFNAYSCKNQIKRSNIAKNSINFQSNGVYAGSFDPITIGHMDVIKRSSGLFDTLTVLVAKNPDKKGFLPVEDRVKLIEKSIQDEGLTNVKVKSENGMTVGFAKDNDAQYLVRGLRNGKDFEGEIDLFMINNRLNSNIDTVLIPTKPDLSMISSSNVRGILKAGGDVSNFVPKCVSEYFKNQEAIK